MLRIVICGEESAGLRVLQALLEQPVRIRLVLTSDTQPNPLRALAERRRIPVHPACEVRRPEFAEVLRRERVDVALNVHSLYIVRPEVLQAPSVGWFNLHPGPLPEMAGLNVPNWAIFRGHRRHAVTLHEMRAGIDTGRIVRRQEFAIEEQETALSLYSKCIRQGVPAIVDFVQRLAKAPGAGYPARDQDSTRREYFGRGVPNGGVVDATMSARQVDRFVRACDFGPYRSPWGHPRMLLRDGRWLELRAGRFVPCACPRRHAPGSLVVHGGAVHRVGCDGCYQVTRARCDGHSLGSDELRAAIQSGTLAAAVEPVFTAPP